MNRRFPCFAAVLLCCCAVSAQVPPAQTGAVSNGAMSIDSPEIREFQKIEDTWAGAVNTRDQYTLELVLSPLFVDIASNGDISTRNQQLANVITGEDKTLHLTQHVVAVRMLGDTAVANGTYTLHHKAGSGETDEKGIFTHVYERQRGTWVCINAQRTVLREDEPGARKKKKSEAEEPFHIPLFSRGKQNR